MSDAPSCAHLTVRQVTERHDDGTCTEHWKCEGCDARWNLRDQHAYNSVASRLIVATATVDVLRRNLAEASMLIVGAGSLAGKANHAEELQRLRSALFYAAGRAGADNPDQAEEWIAAWANAEDGRGQRDHALEAQAALKALQGIGRREGINLTRVELRALQRLLYSQPLRGDELQAAGTLPGMVAVPGAAGALIGTPIYIVDEKPRG